MNREAQPRLRQVVATFLGLFGIGLLALAAWMLSINAPYLFSPESSSGLAVLIALPVIVAGLVCLLIGLAIWHGRRGSRLAGMLTLGVLGYAIWVLFGGPAKLIFVGLCAAAIVALLVDLVRQRLNERSRATR